MTFTMTGQKFPLECELCYSSDSEQSEEMEQKRDIIEKDISREEIRDESDFKNQQSSQIIDF